MNAEDPSERLGGREPAGAAVGDERRPARGTWRATTRLASADSTGSRMSFLSSAQHVPRLLRQRDRVLEAAHEPSRYVESVPAYLRHRPVDSRCVLSSIAPGRVNLIGDHTDYQDGFCLPMAIDRAVVVRFGPRSDGRVVVHSRELPGTSDLPADGSAVPGGVEPAWGRTVAAVLRVLATRGRSGAGVDADVTSTVPLGSGLSSSAAFGVAFALACGARRGPGARRPRARARRAGGRASREWRAVRRDGPDGLGVRRARVMRCCSTAARLAVDPVAAPARCRGRRRAQRACPADSRTARTRSGGRRAKPRPHGSGVATLRDATPEQVADDPIARHVVSENARVLAFVDALRAARPRPLRAADAREPRLAPRRLRGVDARARRCSSTALMRRRARSGRGSRAPGSADASSPRSRPARRVAERYRSRPRTNGCRSCMPPTARRVDRDGRRTDAEHLQPDHRGRAAGPVRVEGRPRGRVPVDRADDAGPHARRARATKSTTGSTSIPRSRRTCSPSRSRSAAPSNSSGNRRGSACSSSARRCRTRTCTSCRSTSPTSSRSRTSTRRPTRPRSTTPRTVLRARLRELGRSEVSD